MKSSTRLVAALGTLGAAALLASSAQAALLLYEGFDYTSPGNIDAQNGGTGFSAAWTTGLTSTPTAVVGSSGLSYAGLSSAGNAWSDAQIGGSTPGNQRNFDGTGLNTDGTSLWFSYLVNATNNGDPTLGFFTTAGNYNSTGFGATINFSTGAVRARIGSTFSDGSFTSVLSTTYLVVGRIDFLNGAAGNDTLRLWINPDLGSAPLNSAALASVSQVAQASWFSSTAYLTLRGSGAYQGFMDEVRLGTSFADVTPAPVPEPSAFAVLAGLGALGFVSSRRRRRA